MCVDIACDPSLPAAARTYVHGAQNWSGARVGSLRAAPFVVAKSNRTVPLRTTPAREHTESASDRLYNATVQ